MSLLFHFSILLLVVLGLGSPAFNSGLVTGRELSHRKLSTDENATCPLDFDALRQLIEESNKPVLSNLYAQCNYVLSGLRLVESLYIKSNGLFLPPSNSSNSCWESYQSVIDLVIPNFDILSSCGFESSWISEGCMNITSLSQFESIVPESSLQTVSQACNQSLESAACASCTTTLSTLQATYLNGSQVGNVSSCSGYPSIYAAGIVNSYGPTNNKTANCLFSLNFVPSGSSNNTLIYGVSIGGGVGLLGLVLSLWFLWKRRNKRRRKGKTFVRVAETNLSSALDSIRESTTLIKFTFEEIKQATRNFSRDNIIGMGGYGNVYKGLLADGSEVALKRFKNCSAAGDANFTHEVEVIASVRHVNLVALRGYCTATTPYEGHQRIIVCDLMSNGSLHDHLFGASDKKLSWPVRQKIALGTAKGLAYLHNGAQPAIIHRDIKASNILLDEMFEPKVADFGLAKFTPEGMTHLSTRVAGTLGYVAPEYALYGQLTERSDVYSYGIVLLELLSGKKALVSGNGGQTILVADWAWSLVRKGRALDVIEEGMPELGAKEIMEKYVLIAVISSHPQLHARPSMEQIVKMLETDLPVPSIPERPVSVVAEIDEIEKSASSSGSGQLSSSTGYQSFTEANNPSSDQLGRAGNLIFQEPNDVIR